VQLLLLCVEVLDKREVQLGSVLSAGAGAA
jgi:hypothetical protein